MRAAVVSSSSLGDGLLMLIAAFYLKQNGYKVTVFHRLMHEMSSFFPDYDFQPYPEKIADLKSFDLAIMEHQTPVPFKDFEEELASFKNLYILCPRKIDLPSHPQTILFQQDKSMAQNIALSMAKILKQKEFFPINGITPPKNLTHQKYPERILLHPLSNNPLKNWRKKKFLRLYKDLQKKGLNPVFLMAPHEEDVWKKEDVKIKTFPNYHELAAYVYESGFLIGNDSGPAHLASNLAIPSLVIAGNRRKMQLWRADFYPTRLIFPPPFIPNFKYFKIKDYYWPHFISTKKVFKAFTAAYNQFFIKNID